MIDLIYKTLLTIINKENQGYISPTEFNILAYNTQMEIFREYFENENRDKLKQNKGYANRGYSNLAFNERQRITQFAESLIIDKVNDIFELPINLYFIEDNGVITNNEDVVKFDGKVVEEVEHSQIAFLRNSETAPTLLYPIYERYSNYIKISPLEVDKITLKYLRIPTKPMWTYVMVNDSELFDPSNPSFQDFELHESEFTNIILRMLVFFGINLRESEVVQMAEMMKDKNNAKENN